MLGTKAIFQDGLKHQSGATAWPFATLCLTTVHILHPLKHRRHAVCWAVSTRTTFIFHLGATITSLFELGKPAFHHLFHSITTVVG
jgi:hypothetical protein